MKLNQTILLLLGVASGHKLHHHHHHRFSGIPIAQRLLQTTSHSQKWDSDVLKVMNPDSYLDDVRDSMNETVLNVESQERPKLGQSDEVEFRKNRPEFAEKTNKKKSQQQLTEDEFNAQEANVTDNNGDVRRSSNAPFQDEPDARPDQTPESKAKEQELKNKQIAAQILAHNKEAELDQEMQAMNKVWHKFGETLDLKQRDKALEMRDNLVKQGLELPELKVQTKQIYENQFEFQDMAQHENVQNMLRDLDVAQGDFNENPSNPSLMNKFIEVSHKTAKDLKQTFPDFWHTPGLKAEGWAKDIE